MMRKEIDMLVEAARKGCVVVEKDSGVLWTLEELTASRNTGQFEEGSALLAPDGQLAISGPYPGCGQQLGATAQLCHYRPVAQTNHFVIFTEAEGDLVPPIRGNQERPAP